MVETVECLVFSSCLCFSSLSPRKNKNLSMTIHSWNSGQIAITINFFFNIENEIYLNQIEFGIPSFGRIKLHKNGVYSDYSDVVKKKKLISVSNRVWGSGFGRTEFIVVKVWQKFVRIIVFLPKCTQYTFFFAKYL